MSRKLVIVESPAKARTISGYLGDEYEVQASVGHIRDLAQPSELPAQMKKGPYGKFAVDIEGGFDPYYVVDADKKKKVTELRRALKEADELYLATDEDREGEAIAWHLLEVLKPKVPVKRMVFHEITKEAIDRALVETRDIDNRLVDAQETRRILDRLYGYEVSPLLWRKVRTGLSAGRVQSVATRMVVNRERERMGFVPVTYWDVTARVTAADRAENGAETTFTTKLSALDDSRVATGRDFADDGTLKPKSVKAGVIHLGEKGATAIAHSLREGALRVDSVESKPYRRRPAAPFTTSTLQQEASRKLRMSSRETMRIAQSLYENGYITYMRTDSTVLSGQAISAARRQAAELYGPEFVPEKPRFYGKKQKGAQEAHEAIRPAGSSFRTPAQVGAAGLMGGELRLYDLIWKRTVASQMEDATGNTATVRLRADLSEAATEAIAEETRGEAPATAVLSASGTVITFRGFLAAYEEGRDAERYGKRDADDQARLPQLERGDAARIADDADAQVVEVKAPAQPLTGPELLAARTAATRAAVNRPGAEKSADAEEELVKEAPKPIVAAGHTTTPPPRYTEASLVKAMEELGIGRPSTYASTIGVITDRGYVDRRGQALVPTWLAFSVVRLMEENLGQLVDYGFTASMEESLDQIAAGERDRTSWLQDFWHGDEEHEGLHVLVENLGDIDARALNSVALGDNVVLRVGRYGPYVEEQDENGEPIEKRRASVPPEIAPDELDLPMAKELLDKQADDGRELGVDPETGHTIVAKTGRFGPYVTEILPDPPLALKKDGTPMKRQPAKPKGRTASLFQSMDIATIELDDALKLLRLPRVVGVSGEGADAKEITAQNGRYGPYLKKGGDSRSLESEEQIFTITLEEAEAIYAQPKRRRGQVARPPLAEFGEDPVSGRKVVLKDGRFGPYITDGETNATLRKDDSIEHMSATRAYELLAEKRAKGPAKRRTAAKKTTATRATTTRKTTPKKPPATTARTVRAKRGGAKG